MSESARAGKGLRARVPLAPQREDGFRWRGEHITRVEGLTDAVFAFAVTLLVVALEGPTDYDGLLDIVRGFPAFVICFTFLMMFWNAHYRFHRRYGLEDLATRWFTMASLVITLFFVYPLKFLFTMISVSLLQLDLRHAPHLENIGQLRVLYLIYGLGFAGVWGLYCLMYVHAYRKRAELGLTPIEVVYTRASIVENGIFVAVCLLSITVSRVSDNYSLPGYTYMVLAPLFTTTGFYYGRKIKALIGTAAPS